MAIQAADLADLGRLTLNDLGKLKWTDLTLDQQELIVMPMLMKKEKVQFDGGKGHQFNLMVSLSGNAQNIGLYQVIQPTVGETMIQGSVPWRHTTTNYSYDRRELAMNRGASQIVNLLKTRRTDAMIGLAKKMEEDFWSKPATSADTIKPFGVDYWIVKNASAGFNGGDPSGFTAGAAGIATATYPRWKNYTDQYVAITKDDLITRWRKAATKTAFKPPVSVEQYNRGAQRYGYYCNYTVIGALEGLLEGQNDNLGNDLASKDGEAMFRKVPVKYVPMLDSTDTQQSIYGIDWSVFYPVFLQGEYMREEGPDKNPNQPSVYTVNIDTSYNWVCKDRRKQMILNIA